MPKKGKKDPTADMTEEERVVYLQQKAQAEEEAARKKEELLTLFLKDKLQMEESNTAVNLLKVNDGWRSILRQARTAELRHDVTVLSQTFERHLDGLDCLLHNLEADIQKADQQAAEVRCIHVRNLKRLQEVQNKRLRILQQQWESGLQLLTSKFNSERKQMLADTRQQRALEDVAFTAEQQNKAVMDETDTLYSDVITTYQGAHHSWTTSMTQATKEEILQKQEDEKVCNRETKKLDQLLSKNQQLIQSTDSEMKRAEKLQEAVILMRQMLSSDKTKKQLVEEDLIAEGNYVKQKTREIREQLIRAQTEARKQLSSLTVLSNKATKKLEATITKGERVLRVAEMYHKLENEQRSVTSALFLAEEPEGSGSETPGQTQEPCELLELPQLMRRFNTAVLQREALRTHRDDVSSDSQQLRLLLQQQLDGLTLSQDALFGSQPLLAVSPAPTTTTAAAAAGPLLDTRGQYTVIEAVHAARHAL